MIPQGKFEHHRQRDDQAQEEQGRDPMSHSFSPYLSTAEIHSVGSASPPLIPL
jgi:hypothetical protein